MLFRSSKGESLSGYSVFAAGNYSVYNEAILYFANHFLFPDHERMMKLYNWALPYYKSAFATLSVEEQMVQWNNLKVAEFYVNTVLEHEDYLGFADSLRKNKLIVDEKIIGFLQRRYFKEQWSLDECAFWIEKLKEDIKPLLKNPKLLSSHYQVIRPLGKNALIAVNHLGEYYILNKQYRPILKEKFCWIDIQEETIDCYRSESTSDIYEYPLSEFLNRGILRRKKTNRFKAMDSFFRFR